MGRARSRSKAAAAARAHGLRLIGPNCLGVMVPAARLNASFAARAPQAGDLALVSQSGAIAAGMVEWAARRKVGFSAVVSLGDQVDVDLADCLDYFAARPIDARHPALRRVGQRRAQVHVGRTRRGARQAGRGGQVRPPRAGRARRRDPYGRARRRRMRFTTRLSGAPACCACAGWTNCSRPPKRSGGSSRSTASASPF